MSISRAKCVGEPGSPRGCAPVCAGVTRKHKEFAVLPPRFPQVFSKSLQILVGEPWAPVCAGVRRCAPWGNLGFPQGSPTRESLKESAPKVPPEKFPYLRFHNFSNHPKNGVAQEMLSIIDFPVQNHVLFHSGPRIQPYAMILKWRGV